MSVISRNLLDTIHAQYTLPWRGTHGVAHWTRVRETALRLAEQTGAKPAIVEWFVALQAAQALAPVTAVRGNVDRGDWVKDLPQKAPLTIDPVSVYVLHDLAALDVVPEPAGTRVVVCGHSHRPVIRERHGVFYVNPGSAGPRWFKLLVGLVLKEIHDTSVDARLVSLDA
jgi:hypothetical protein